MATKVLHVLCGANIEMSIPAADKVSLIHLDRVGGFTDLFGLMSYIKSPKSSVLTHSWAVLAKCIEQWVFRE